MKIGISSNLANFNLQSDNQQTKLSSKRSFGTLSCNITDFNGIKNPNILKYLFGALPRLFELGKVANIKVLPFKNQFADLEGIKTEISPLVESSSKSLKKRFLGHIFQDKEILKRQVIGHHLKSSQSILESVEYDIDHLGKTVISKPKIYIHSKNLI